MEDELLPPPPAKKSLGQNFLTSRAVVHSIVEAGAVSSKDIVVEIGPGRGILTEALLPVAREVIAIEKDEALALRLSLAFRKEIGEKRLALVVGDALEWNPASAKLQPGGYKLIANIPYYITGAIIRKFLGEETHPSTAVLMVQREVATRIVARDGKESILSIAVKAYGEPTYVQTVKAGSFSPAPSVDSAVLKIEHISHDRFTAIAEEHFFALVKAGFAHKRKRLASNLTAVSTTPAIKDAFATIGLDENVRAEDVPLDGWFALARMLPM